jgi:hypothetical protein
MRQDLGLADVGWTNLADPAVAVIRIAPPVQGGRAGPEAAPTFQAFSEPTP